MTKWNVRTILLIYQGNIYLYMLLEYNFRLSWEISILVNPW